MGSDTAAEMVVLCDDDGAAAGVVAKAAVHHRDTPLHLAFSCYLFRTEDDGALGDVLVTRRAFGKRTFPGVRTNSCCGHPSPGEAMVDAIERRVRHELGLTATEISLILPAFRYRAVAEDGTVENELCPVYRAVVTEHAVRPNPAEVAQAWWVPWAQFVDGTDARDPLSEWGERQVDALAAVGPDPGRWPTADSRLLPAAAGHTAAGHTAAGHTAAGHTAAR